MKSHWQYCGACDRTVRVFVTEASSEEGQALAMDPELICLDIGASCNGAMCPLGASAPSGMVRRLIHDGIPPGSLETVASHCPICGQEGEMVRYGENQACCSICGSVGRWVTDHLEPI